MRIREDYRDVGVAPRETLDMRAWQPSCLALHASGELHDRAQRAVALLEDRCRVVQVDRGPRRVFAA